MHVPPVRRVRSRRTPVQVLVALWVSTLAAAASLVLLTAEAAATPPTLTWLARYTGTIGNNETSAMAVDADGNSYVTGASEGIGWDVATVKYDASGNQVWAVRYDSGHGGDDIPVAIALDPSGDVIVAGYTEAAIGNHDYLTLKYSPQGVLLWYQTYSASGNPGLDQVFAMAVDASGNIYVTGDSVGGATGHDVATVKYSPSGAQLWARRWDGPAHKDDAANGIALDPDGNVYVTGLVTRVGGGVPDYDILTLKYDSSGTLLWSDEYFGGGLNDEGVALVVDSALNVYAAGFTIGTHSDYNGTLIKYSPSGAEVWVRTYDDPAHGEDSFKAIALSPAGRIGVTGFASPTGSLSDPDYLTIQYDAAGNAEWTSLYDGPAHDYDMAYSIAYDAGGNAYVTGSSNGGTMQTGYDYATLRYSPTGNTDWLARWDGGGQPYYNNDNAKVVTVGPGNSIYVSGWSPGSRAPLVDFVTIRYDQSGSSSAPGGSSTFVGVPARLGIAAAGANPFQDRTRLAFTLPVDGRAEITLWDPTGRKVRSLVAGSFTAGAHEVAVDGGSFVPGVYFARLQTAEGEATAKLLRIR